MDSYQKNIISSPSRLSKKGLESENLFVLRGARPDGIIICGMGGSGLAGMILRYSRKDTGLDLPVFSWRNYELPEMQEFGLKHPLYIFTSFSGNTEETVSAYHLAQKKRSLTIAVIATGGKLLQLAEKNHSPLVRFPAEDLTPRQGVGRMFYALIQILQAAKLISQKEFDYRHMDARKEMSLGRSLAKKIFNRTAVIYTDREHEDLGYLWKITINETGKQPAFLNVLPEMHHNEISGFEKNINPFVALLLYPPKLSPAMRKRFAVTHRMLSELGVPIVEINLSYKNKLEQVWRKLMLTEWVGYYLAQMHKADPAATPTVDAIKQFLKK